LKSKRFPKYLFSHASHSLSSGPHYPEIDKWFVYFGRKAHDFPESKKASKGTLAPPIFPGLRGEEMEEVVSRIKEALG
jgi:dTDP-4-amino-4,6-dideoxygalactose transaminase